MDTWHILEQRFNEIANRDHTVTMFYRRMNGDQLYVRFQGPVPKDRFRFLAVRDELATFRESGGSLPADLSGDSHTVSELTSLLVRAGQLVEMPGDEYDRMDFLIMSAVREFEPLFADAEPDADGCRYFANVARVFGCLCGKFASQVPRVKITGYSMTELKKMIGVQDNTTVGKYLDAANLPRAEKYQKKWALSQTDAIAFLRQVIEKPRVPAHRVEAEKSLRKLS